MSQITVSIRELKSRLSHYLRLTRAGATVVITDRGVPVGRIVPMGPRLETSRVAAGCWAAAVERAQAPGRQAGRARARPAQRGAALGRGPRLIVYLDASALVKRYVTEAGSSEVGEPLVARAAALTWEHGLRGYDAVHLASALWWREAVGDAVTVATYDRELWRSARAAGLTASPGQQPPSGWLMP